MFLGDVLKGQAVRSSNKGTYVLGFLFESNGGSDPSSGHLSGTTPPSSSQKSEGRPDRICSDLTDQVWGALFKGYTNPTEEHSPNIPSLPEKNSVCQKMARSS
jgi:hypothetical protein